MPAGSEPRGRFTHKLPQLLPLLDRLRARGTSAMHVHPFDAIVEHLEEVLRDQDLVVVMGAGPVWRIGRALVDRAGGDAAFDEAAGKA